MINNNILTIIYIKLVNADGNNKYQYIMNKQNCSDNGNISSKCYISGICIYFLILE